MPHTTTANYDTEAAKRNKQPVWVIEIDGISDPKFSSGSFSGITSAYKKFIKDISLDYFDFDVRNNTYNPTAGKFVLVDKNLAVTSLIKDYVLHGRAVTIKHGFAGLAISDFLSVYQQLYIDDIEENRGEYIFQFSDPTYALKGNFFDSLTKTKLASDLSSGGLTVTVEDTTGFLSSANDFTNLYIRIENEIIQYNSLTSTTFSVGARGAFGTSAVAHLTGAVVEQIYIPDDAPCEILLFLLMTTSAGTNGEFDIGIANFGAGIAKSKIDIDSFRSIGMQNWAMFNSDIENDGVSNYDLTSTNSATVFSQPESQTSLASKLLSMINCSFSIASDGRLSLKRADYFGSINASNNLTNKTAWMTGNLKIIERRIANTVIINAPAYPNGTGDRKKYIVKFDDSVTVFGERLFKEIDWVNGFFPDLGGISDDKYATYTMIEALLLYGDHQVAAKVDSLFDNMKYLPGDVIGISENNAPDFNSAIRGITNEPFLILSKSSDFQGLSFSLEAYDYINKVSSPTILGSYETPDDQTLTQSFTDTHALEAADAYKDNPSGTNNFWQVRLTITPPASGGAVRQSIVIAVRFMVNSTTEATAGNKAFRNIGLFYDPSKSAVLTYELNFFLPTARTLQRVKVDLTSNAGSATVAFTGVRGKNITNTFSQTEQILQE